MRRYTDNLYYLVVIGFVFTLSFTVLFRALAQYSLMAQFLILMGFDEILCDTYNKKSILRWGIIFTLCISIHFYFFFMLLILFAGYLLNSLIYFLKIKFALIASLICAAISIGVSYIEGYLIKTTSPTYDGGYGVFSANLNFLFNRPNSTWGLLLPSLNYQYEGVGYLGAGMILLFIFSLFFIPLWWNKTNNRRLLWGIGGSAVAALLFAITHIVTFGNKILFTIPLPQKLIILFSAVRASGRFITVLTLLILLFSFYMLLRYVPSIKWRYIIITFVFAIQMIDVIYYVNNRNAPPKAYANSSLGTSLNSDFWAEQANSGVRHIIFCPHSTVNNNIKSSSNNPLFKRRVNFQDFTEYAINNGMTTNRNFSVRSDIKNIDIYTKEKYNQLLEGHIEPDEMIILGSLPNAIILSKIPELSVLYVDEYMVVIPKNAELEKEYSLSLMPLEDVPVQLSPGIEYNKLKEFTTIEDIGITNGAPDIGSWLSSHDTIILKRGEYTKYGMKINISIPTDAFLLAGNSPESKVEILVDGTLAVSISIGEGDIANEIVEIPASYFVGDGEICKVDIYSPTFNPCELFASADDRDLGIALYDISVNN